jgi:hypothetical protein
MNGFSDMASHGSDRRPEIGVSSSIGPRPSKRATSAWGHDFASPSGLISGGTTSEICKSGNVGGTRQVSARLAPRSAPCASGGRVPTSVEILMIQISVKVADRQQWWVRTRIGSQNRALIAGREDEACAAARRLIEICPIFASQRHMRITPWNEADAAHSA